ncbi:MAG: asparaginase domain-containing protein [Candidatus Paceibacterota bacterium]|jgi:L-asparaginase
MTIQFFITGGTIDDVDYDSLDNIPQKPKSFVPELLDLLKQSNVTIDFSSEILFLKDSRFIFDEDRKVILEKCQSCKSEKIIITHGSFTMAETAKFLLKQNIGKTIVLVGSITPINKNKSDALFNLGGAITAVQLLESGVYVTMNGQIFTADNVRKNVDKVIFEKEF